MSPHKTLATAMRVLAQLRHDKRTLGLVLFVPCLLLVLLRYVFDRQIGAFDSLAPIMLGIFPLIMMFLVTSITTLRERTSGTLDRLLTMPVSKLDFMFGYALAFTLLGLLQAILVCSVTLGLLGVVVGGGSLPIVVVSVSAAFLGTALGLLVSAFATSEFQAVQLVMPIMMPQILLCGLFVPRDHMASVLQSISDFLPLTYCVDAMKLATDYAVWTPDLTRDIAIVIGIGFLALLIGSLTIRRR